MMKTLFATIPLSLCLSLGTVVFSTSLVGCRLDDNRLRGNIKIPIHRIDFKKTEILENGPVPADGSSELILLVHLKNSDGTVVPNYRPEYEVVSGPGVIEAPCTESTKDGISACLLRANQAGAKVLRLVNAKVGLEKEVYFESPHRKGRILGLISGAETSVSTTPGNYWGEFSLGNWTEEVQLESNDGYQGFFSVQGDFVSM